MEHNYILSILYEMALAIGGEVSVKPLLTRMLQRLLYHTSFPTGFVCLGVPFAEADSAGMIEVRIDAAVGDYGLAGLIGQTVRLPARLLLGAAESGEDTALLTWMPDKNSRYKAFLRLPIDGEGVVVLLAPQLPESELPLKQLFQPVMASLSKAIVLCRSHDAYTAGLIAARDASQQAQVSSEEKFRAISSAVLDALIMVDDSSALVYWNPAAERILGYSADEALGKPLHQLLTPQRYQNRAVQGFNAFRNNGQGAVIGKTIEIEALHKDGREIPVELSITALKLNDRWHAVGILRDITEHKRAAATRTQLAAIVEFSSDAIIGKTPDGIITSWNKGAERIYGYSDAEAIGQPVTMLVQPSRHAPLLELLERIRRGESVANLECERIRRDGSLINVALTLSPIRDAAGNVTGISTIARDITKNKRMEEALQRSVHGLAEAQRIAHLGNWELDLENNVLIWSDEIYRIFEIDPEKFGASYEAFLEAIHPDDRELVNNAYTESLNSKNPYDIVHRLLMKNGRVKYVNEKCETYFGADGKPLRSVGTVHDITESKLGEEALQRLNRELRAISNCNQTLMRADDEQTLLGDICRIICDDAGYLMAWVGYPENDADKTIRPVSRAGAESGYLEHAMLTWADTEHGQGPSGTAIRNGISVTIQDFLADPKAGPWREAAEQRGYRSSISLPLKDESAKTFGILSIYSSMPNAFTPEEIRLLEELAGDMAFGIMVLRARIERRLVAENLRQLNERFSLATRAGRLGVWDWNLHKNELVWDDRMYELYGVKREDFSGAYEAWLQGIHPDDRTASDEISKQAQRGEREYDTGFRVVWPDKSVHYLKAYGQFVRDADGRAVRMTGVNFDITELKEAEHKISELNRNLEQRVEVRTAQLEAANKELEAFSYSVSHDLRSPLRAIDGFSHILLEDYAEKLDGEGKRLLGVVRENTNRMGKLIDDILKFSRSGRTEITFSRIDMENLAHAVAAELLASDPGGKVQMEIGPIPPTSGDNAMMRQVFVNLISNAIKFSHHKTAPMIRIGATADENETIYFVKDNGAGFDMQFADKLFGVFQRLHSVTEFEGTGIGLAIVKRIIMRHGGRVWAEGKIGEGATLYFAIPTARKQ